jgi:hypothetical protein
MKTLQVIWVALFMSIVMYAAIAFAIIPVGEGRVVAAITSNPIVLAVYAAAFMVVVGSFLAFAALSRQVEKQQVAHIVRWAMIESAAIFGLVAAFIASDRRLFIPLGVLALAAMIVAFPREEAPPAPR